MRVVEDPYELVTPSQLRVIQLLAYGLSQPQIAEHLGINHEAVKQRLHRAYHRLGVTGATDAVAFCLRHGLIR